MTSPRVPRLAAASDRVRRATVIAGVFLFALAVTATTLENSDPRTVEVQFVGDAGTLAPASESTGLPN